MAKETFKAARERILRELREKGWTTKPDLRVPQAIRADGNVQLFFRPQAVYRNGLGSTMHSLWIDIRGMSIEIFLIAANKIHAPGANIHEYIEEEQRSFDERAHFKTEI